MPPSKSKSSSSDSLSTTFGFAAAFFFTILAPKSPSCSQNWCIMSVLQKMRLKFARTISLSFGISPRRFAIGMNLKIETVKLKATGQKGASTYCNRGQKQTQECRQTKGKARKSR